MYISKPLKKIIFLSILLLSLLLLLGCAGEQKHSFEEWQIIEEERIAAAEESVNFKGKVLEILSDEEDELEGFFTVRTQMVKVIVSNGPFKGEVIEVHNNIDTKNAYNIILKERQSIFFTPEIDQQGNIVNAHFTDMVRDKYLIALTCLFLFLLILIGRFKGLRAAISLGLTAAAIFFVLIPLILKGYNPVVVSVLLGVVITFLTLIIISGANRKSFSAIIGTSCGIIIGGLLALIFGSLANLTGLSNDEAVMLMYIPQNIDFDFRGVLFAGIILASLGAVMDVSMSISSSMLEVIKTDPTIKKRTLINSGMNIGTDIIGTMSNTLILVYIAGAIPLMLLFKAYQIPFVEIVNQDR